MMTREQESMNLFHQSSQLLKTKSQLLSPVHFGTETRDDEIAVDVALPEEPTGMSGESGRSWITEEAFFTVSPGARQVRQRKEVKMNHLSPAETREFLKSMRSRTKQPKYYSGRNGPSSSALAGSCDGRSLCAYLEARRKQDHRGAVQRHDLSFRVLQTLTSLILSHIPRHSPMKVFDSLTVCVQPWTQLTSRRCAAGVQHPERTTTLRQKAARCNPR